MKLLKAEYNINGVDVTLNRYGNDVIIRWDTLKREVIVDDANCVWAVAEEIRAAVGVHRGSKGSKDDINKLYQAIMSFGD